MSSLRCIWNRWLPGLALLMVLATAGCGDGTSSTSGGKVEPCIEGATVPCPCDGGTKGTRTCSDGAMGSCVCPEADIAQADTTGSTDTADAVDAGSSTDTATATDVTVPDTANNDVQDDCPGGPGCACSDNSACQTGLCIDDPAVAGGKACARKCEGSCPDGYGCSAVPSGSGDIVSICIPKFAHLCEPCSSSKDCASLGLKDPACVDQGALGKFCGVACAADGDCPGGYQCGLVPTAEGGTLKQCVRKADEQQQPFGLCPCNPAAIQKKLATTCYIESKDETGKVIGKCGGQRSCTADGLGPCTAAAPKTEQCNGEDDDCDGQTDEGGCDDKNPCTQDSCDGKGGCSHKAQDGQACDADGSACTTGDSCVGAVCTAGPKKKCDDKNPCTIDSCDAAIGCTQTSDDGLPCDDDNPCTVGDICKDSGCMGGKPKSCAASEDCTVGKCDLTTGNCKYGPAADTSPCDDGLVCTAGDSCLGGSCSGKAKACDDGLPCTADSCDPKQGCVSTPQPQGACDDGNPCTAGDACAGGACQPGQPISCNDQNPCTADSCDPKQGCLSLPTAGIEVDCYNGPPASQGKGICKGGKQICDAKGLPSACEGAVLPAPSDACNGIDDTCDGVTDEGCKPVGFELGQSTLRYQATGQNYGVDVRIGQSIASAPMTALGAKIQAWLGSWRWWKGVTP